MTDDIRPGPGMGDEAVPVRPHLGKTGRKDLMPPDWDEAADGEWDDEYASPEFLAEARDLQDIIEYLNKRLDPERTALVAKRLEEDAAFRELAAPVQFIWSIPKHLERHPRPAGELERSWDEFTKRAGFTHQKRKTRRRRLWLLGLALLVIGASAYVSRASLRDWYVTQRDYVAVETEGREGWIPFGDSVFVDPEPGASVLARRDPVDERLHAILKGQARFLVARRDTAGPTLYHQGIVVRTRAGIVSTDEAEFTVTARGDTTEAEVHRPSKRSYFWFIPHATGVELRSADEGEPLLLGELRRGRLVRGKDQHPTRLPHTKEP